jgi:hypothetical protein
VCSIVTGGLRFTALPLHCCNVKQASESMICTKSIPVACQQNTCFGVLLQQLLRTQAGRGLVTRQWCCTDNACVR